jgi:hypothetical protein
MPKRHLLINGMLAKVQVPRILSQTSSIYNTALQVRRRNPALVVSLCARGDGGAVSADNGDLVGGVDVLGALGRLLRALSALAATLLLGEEGGDPRVVDKVGDSTEDSEDDEV